MYVISCQFDHRSSVTLFKEANILYYNECARLTRKKYGSDFSMQAIKSIKSIVGEDVCNLILTGYDAATPQKILKYKLLFKNLGVNIQDCITFSYSHHLTHAVRAFFASGFEEAAIIVWDGRGSTFELFDGSNVNTGYETTSIFYFDKSQNIRCVFKRVFVRDNFKNTLHLLPTYSGFNFEKKLPYVYDEQTSWFITDQQDIGKLYTIITEQVGFDRQLDQEGKTMGLQSYGTFDTLIASRSNEQIIFNKDVIKQYRNRKFKFYVNEEKYAHLKKSEVNDQALKNLAYTSQQVIQSMGKKVIDYALDATKTKNIVFSGGVSLNVVANNYYREKISKDVNFYIEPLCGDEGNSIGAGILYYYDQYKKGNFTAFNKVKENFINNTLYIGSSINYDFNLQAEEQIVDGGVAQASSLLEQGHLVAILHGQAEAGPRALGNRSILFDPRNKDGKDIVNSVKRREYFRPFAFTMMAEYASEWFYMNGLNDSPFMMYAVKVKEQYKNLIPAVIHVDNTCRIQTVTKEQNLILYELLFQFYKKTGIPGVLNTSFNLAGDPIVETIDDALDTLRRSRLEYLFLPEIKKIICIKNVEMIQ